jgi:DNA-binding NtrC family response regulator
MRSILIIEAEQKWRNFLSEALSSEYQISYCSGSRDLAKKIKLVQFDIILLGLQDDDDSILAALGDIKKISPCTPVVITSGVEKAELVVTAIKEGAFDFIIKPYTAAKIKASLAKGLDNVSLKNELDYLRREQDVIYDLNKIIAVSSVMKQVLEGIKKFSQTDSTILMTGETGTGKSMLSGAVHYNSLRRAKPFVKINCANIQETLLESELFGHEKGAFTGADKLRIGRFEQANGGSIFLDEIGEMSMILQAKLLRVIEEKSFERVGGNRTIHSNVRIIAATNKNLDDLVAKGKFREDLFYRINVLPIRLPPLRQRHACLEPLAKFLLGKLCRSLRKQIAGFSPEALTAIQNYSWPGNIRQLANTIERAILVEEDEFIKLPSLMLPNIVPTEPAAAAAQNVPVASGRTLVLSDSERDNIIAALEKSLWIQKDAAEILGVSPRVLNHKIKKLGITHKRWRKFK